VVLNKARVAVVVLNYNGQRLLEEFLPSVLRSTYPGVHIIVGDNASSDGSVAWLKANHPSVEIIQNDKNYGFAEGYNKILKQVTADYYVLLNSDVKVEPNWIEPIIEQMEANTEVAIVQPKLLSYRNSSEFEYAGASGGFIDRLGYPFCRGRIFDTMEKDEGQYQQITEVFWASGAALFVRAELYHKAGGLDGDFFAHMEEIDFCWRIKNMGYKVMVNPKSVVYHLGGGTLEEGKPQKTYLNFRNSLIALRKNLPLYKSFGVIAIRHVLDLVQWLRFVVEGKFSHAWAINRAHYDFMVTQATWYSKRKKIVKLIKRNHTVGMYSRSIVFDYFIAGKKKFTDLEDRYFD
jgi:hypothetical protein